MTVRQRTPEAIGDFIDTTVIKAAVEVERLREGSKDAESRYALLVARIDELEQRIAALERKP